MPPRHILPRLWLISDARNDAVLAWALRRLPRGGAVIYRHHHLPPEARLERYREIAQLARRHGHLLILAGNSRDARRRGAAGAYGGPRALRPRRAGLVRLASVHSLREIGEANRAAADAVLLSPVFPTRSHPGGRTLGVLRFRLLAAHASSPVIALGGMGRDGARRLGWPLWAAIDGLSGAQAGKGGERTRKRDS